MTPLPKPNFFYHRCAEISAGSFYIGRQPNHKSEIINHKSDYDVRQAALRASPDSLFCCLDFFTFDFAACFVAAKLSLMRGIINS